MNIHHGDGFAALKALPSDSAELVFCDPDWGIGLKMDHEGDYQVGETAQNCEKAVELWWERFSNLFDTITNGLLVAPNVMLKLSGKTPHITEVFFHLGEDIGCGESLQKYLAEVFVWDKGPGAPGMANQGIAAVPETLWWFTRDGDRAHRVEHAEWKALQAVIRARRVQKDKRLTQHPLEMPRKLCEWIIKGFTAPGDRIIDVCAGSGALGVYAAHFGREYDGWETHLPHVEAAREALARAVPLVDRHAELWGH